MDSRITQFELRVKQDGLIKVRLIHILLHINIYRLGKLRRRNLQNKKDFFS